MFSNSRREFFNRVMRLAAASGVVAGLPALVSAAPMIKCPFCGFENEDGALFCEQCKSDLSGVPPTPPPPPPSPSK
jgi:hypothetical protein